MKWGQFGVKLNIELVMFFFFNIQWSCMCSFVLLSNWFIGPTLHKWNVTFLFLVAYSVREIHKIPEPVFHFCQLLFFCVLCSSSQLQPTLFTPSVWFFGFFWLPPSPVSLMFWGSFFCSASFIFSFSSCFFVCLALSFHLLILSLTTTALTKD